MEPTRRFWKPMGDRCLQDRCAFGVAKCQRHEDGDDNDDEEEHSNAICRKLATLVSGITVAYKAHDRILQLYCYSATAVP